MKRNNKITQIKLLNSKAKKYRPQHYKEFLTTELMENISKLLKLSDSVVIVSTSKKTVENSFFEELEMVLLMHEVSLNLKSKKNYSHKNNFSSVTKTINKLHSQLKPFVPDFFKMYSNLDPRDITMLQNLRVSSTNIRTAKQQKAKAGFHDKKTQYKLDRINDLEFNERLRVLCEELKWLEECVIQASNIVEIKPGKNRIKENHQIFEALCKIFYKYTGEIPHATHSGGELREVNGRAVDYLEMFGGFHGIKNRPGIKSKLKRIPTAVYSKY